MKTFSVVQDASASALALSPDSSQVVIAGSHVFKIFSIGENEFIEKINLRSAKNLNLNFSCVDIVWNPIDENILATGATNGAVVTWNIKKSSRSKLDYVYKDHERTVNKVNFHPTEGNLLLSGSQDGVMKLFDLRKKESVSTFTSKAEVVRDVQFSPHVSHLFAAGIEDANVQLWDIRRPDRFERQFTGHRGPVFTLDWHPEVKNWLATGSRDSTIKIWDISDMPTVRNIIKTVASVAKVRWRPGKKFHFASCALTLDCRISVWDVRRPYIPLASFNEHTGALSGIFWRNENSLLSAGKDFSLYHHHYGDSARPMESTNPVSVNVSPFGDVVLAIKKKEEHIEVPVVTTLVRQSSSKHSKKPSLVENICSVTSSLQILECTDSSPLSSKCLSELARSYKVSGNSLTEVCEHNETVAMKHGRMQEMATWQLILTIYGDTGIDEHKRFPSGNKDDMTPLQDINVDNENRISRGPGEIGESYSEENDSDPYDKHDLDFLENIACGKNLNFDYIFGDRGDLFLDYDSTTIDTVDACQNLTVPQLPHEAFQPRQNLPLRSNSPPEQFYPNKEFTSLMNRDPEDQAKYIEPVPMFDEVSPFKINVCNLTNLVIDMLHHYVDSGNVQMAVTVVVVLDQRIIKHISEEILEHWFLAYIDILHRLKLWNVATEIIKHSKSIIPVFQINQISTTFYQLCGGCGGSVPAPKYYCQKCLSVVSRCSVCHEAVRGLFVCCQGCSHGGHLEHITDWIRENQECPAGCGHLCEYT